MRLHEAGPDDAERLAPLFDSYRQFYDQPADTLGAREFLADRLRNKESVVFYLADENKANVAGFVQLYPSFSSVSMKKLWILNDLFVAEPFRRRECARKLLGKAEEYARATGAKGLTLKTASDNIPAQALYQDCDWKMDEVFLTFSKWL